MSLITLSTDFGMDDPYVGIMKGVILGINPQAQVIDLTHALSNRRLLEAAFVLQTAYSYFPVGTVHLTVVDPGVGGERRLLAIQGEKMIWVGPDNGLFTVVLKKQPQSKIIHLTQSAFFLKKVSSTFHGRDILAPVAAHLSLGISFEEMGSFISDPVILPFPEPEIKEKEISGQVLWADHFGNLITNINQETLLPFLSSPALTIFIGSESITEILQTYSQSLPGRLMALIGSSGYLEIACNLGRATEKVGFQSSRDLKVLVTCL
jgi:S-adenosyl-L-methionine hydrolase (adenosine-forming)